MPATPLTPAFLAELNEAFEASPSNVVARNAMTSTNWYDVVVDRRELQRLTHTFAKKLPDAKVCNQNETGRCWLFAASTLLRRALQTKYALSPDFEISQNFFYFYDKLEKCNFFFENILATADRSVDDRLVHHFLADPTNDGGQWDMLVNIVNKYGAVPKNVYGEAKCTEDSERLNLFLSAKLRDFAAELRRLHATDPSALDAAKRRMLGVCHRILSIFLGSPPTHFDFEAHDKDEVYVSVLNCTPRSFLTDVVPISLNDYVSIVNDPRHAYGSLLTVDRLGNVVEGNPIRYLNLPTTDLARYAKAQLDADLPVWFGCDCDADSELEVYGVYSKQLYAMEAVFGTQCSMTKRERMEYQNGSMTHAMVFTGYSGSPLPTKWKVENSWGKKRGDAGYDIMTDAWFDDHMYQVVVLQKFLDPEHLAQWRDGTPLVLPVWDPMGNCL
ncbi:hypothetical protein SPRG_17535 [Saprolegnia parasitica CBS 223.65]|uniref:bleomycin hydrolase n=1 Tax=Saprolegnia parasitica (strain CBS 223.65) TaxID=695850 RepID=A0A067BRV2_SAPPC|nr:hypothetical protein SPRG_17535 [Saprolegnia parasitica CBS 223.65]KDO17036.1 hypothetical protein SPRG_17535 [Saprolegnia parasitica CBS 223.65]|eukprot:XP_012212255.1 hypothetical protein SPRG_17535 [Saprolegnia parasitica CBS 223.65]